MNEVQFLRFMKKMKKQGLYKFMQVAARIAWAAIMYFTRKITSKLTKSD